MEVVEISVVGPGSASSARFQIAPTDLFVDLRAALLESPTFCTYTSYRFESEGSACSDYDQIGSERRQLKIVEVPYTYTSIREHVQRFQDLILHPAKKLSIEYWLKNLVSSNNNNNNNNNKSGSDQDQQQIVPVDFAIDVATQPECEPNDRPASLSSSVWVRKSPYDPPTGSRRLQGDLIYLDVEIGDQIVHITGNQAGFFVNKTRDSIFNPSCKLRTGHRSSTLAALLIKTSAWFRTEFNRLLSEYSGLHPLMQAPSAVPSSGHAIYTVNDGHEPALLYNGVRTERNWNDEFLTWSDQPIETTAEGALTRFRNQYKIYADFVNNAISGAIAVVQGEIAALNINEPRSTHVYLHDNIFFSMALDSRSVYADHGGDYTAHKFASHDLHASHIVSRLLLGDKNDARLNTLMSVVVDYAGVRLVCQGIIPGILNSGGSTLLFGSIDQSPDGVEPSPMAHVNKTDSQSFMEMTAKLSERLHWSSSDILDHQGNVLGSVSLPMDCKGLSTSDGRTYLMDLVRITPRDANYPDTLSAVLRVELVNRWCHDIALKKVMKSDASEGDALIKSAAEPADGDERAVTAEQDGEVVAAESKFPCFVSVAEIEAEAAAIRFNVNCMTQYRVVNESPDDIEVLQRLAKSIHEQAIPAIVNDMMSLSVSFIDSRACANLFHSHGVNMRYLGHVHRYIIDKLLDKLPNLCQTLATCIYREILVRSCKHMLSMELRVQGASAPIAAVITTFFNNVLQRHPKTKPRTAFWNRLYDQMSSRFSYSPDDRVDCTPTPMSILTGLCQAMGLSIMRRQYDFSESGKGITVDDLLDMRPVSKYHLPDSIDTASVLATARSKLANDDQAAAHEILSQLVQVLCSVTGSIHADVAEAYSLLSLISYRSGDTVSAIDHSYRVIVICERLYGSVDGELARAHSQHALFLMCGGFHERALHHGAKAKQLFELLGGPCYPETATAMLNLGVIFMHFNKLSEALQVQLDGLSRLESGIGADAPHLHLITACHQVAFSYAVLRQFRDAVRYEQRARSIAQSLGNEIIVAQCNSWLALFTKGAVLAAKNDPQQITVKPTTAALSWIAAPQLAKSSSFSSIKEVIYFNNDTIQQLQEHVERQDDATPCQDGENSTNCKIGCVHQDGENGSNCKTDPIDQESGPAPIIVNDAC